MVLSDGAGLVAVGGAVDEVVVDRAWCGSAGVTAQLITSETGRASVCAVRALMVQHFSKLVRGAGNSAIIHVQKVSNAVDALAGLAHSQRGARGAGRDTLCADISDGVLEFSAVASR